MTAPRLVLLDPDLSLGRTLIRILREHGFDVVAVPDDVDYFFFETKICF